MLKKLSIYLGILISLIAVINGVYDLVEKFLFIPDQTEEVALSLINKQPLISREIVVQPRQSTNVTITMRVNIFDTGDIVIISGDNSKLIPFRMAAIQSLSQTGFSIFNSAYAQPPQIQSDTTRYEVNTVKYINFFNRDEKNLKETIIYEDGKREVKTIDMRSFKIIQQSSDHIELTPELNQKIQQSTFSKQIFTPVQTIPDTAVTDTTH